MVVTNVHAVSAASMGANEYQADSSGSDFNYGDKKGDATVTQHEARSDTDSIDPEQSAGLKKMEAITMVWTKKWLIAAYALYVARSGC